MGSERDSLDSASTGQLSDSSYELTGDVDTTGWRNLLSTAALAFLQPPITAPSLWALPRFEPRLQALGSKTTAEPGRPASQQMVAVVKIAFR